MLAADGLLIGVGNLANVRVGKAARALLVCIATPLKAAAAKITQQIFFPTHKLSQVKSCPYHQAIARKLLRWVRKEIKIKNST